MLRRQRSCVAEHFTARPNPAHVRLRWSVRTISCQWISFVTKINYTDLMETSKPLISVVMPVYNALPFVDDSIDSILNQTFSNFEFVIFDDASTDGSVEQL